MRILRFESISHHAGPSWASQDEVDSFFAEITPKTRSILATRESNPFVKTLLEALFRNPQAFSAALEGLSEVMLGPVRASGAVEAAATLSDSEGPSSSAAGAGLEEIGGPGASSWIPVERLESSNSAPPGGPLSQADTAAWKTLHLMHAKKMEDLALLAINTAGKGRVGGTFQDLTPLESSTLDNKCTEARESCLRLAIAQNLLSEGTKSDDPFFSKQIKCKDTRERVRERVKRGAKREIAISAEREARARALALALAPAPAPAPAPALALALAPAPALAPTQAAPLALPAPAPAPAAPLARGASPATGERKPLKECNANNPGPIPTTWGGGAKPKADAAKAKAKADAAWAKKKASAAERVAKAQAKLEAEEALALQLEQDEPTPAAAAVPSPAPQGKDKGKGKRKGEGEPTGGPASARVTAPKVSKRRGRVADYAALGGGKPKTQ